MSFTSFNVFELLEERIREEENDASSQSDVEAEIDYPKLKASWASENFNWADYMNKEENTSMPTTSSVVQNEDVETENDGWTTISSKVKEKKEKRKEVKERVEKRRVERDVRYLLTHAAFQKHRLTRDLILDYKQIASEDGSLYIIGHGRCRGHLIDYHENKDGNPLQTCLECSWKSQDFKAFHCCCPEEVKNDLPPNFYLGCNGPVNDYLYSMREKDI